MSHVCVCHRCRYWFHFCRKVCMMMLANYWFSWEIGGMPLGGSMRDFGCGLKKTSAHAEDTEPGRSPNKDITM